MNSKRIAPLSPVAAALLVLGCSLAPPPELPDPASEMPADFEQSPAPRTYEPLQWWKAFADPALDRIVDSVLSSNLDMAAAVARVEQARERARIARAAILPVVQAGAGIHDLTNPPTRALAPRFRNSAWNNSPLDSPCPNAWESRPTPWALTSPTRWTSGGGPRVPRSPPAPSTSRRNPTTRPRGSGSSRRRSAPTSRSSTFASRSRSPAGWSTS